jgi:hypothetical protein
MNCLNLFQTFGIIISKTMKKISLILLFIFTISFYAQSSNDFFGTWEYQNGNEISRIHLFEQTTIYQGESMVSIAGHFSMIEINSNGVETIVFNSDKPYSELSSTHWHPVILGGMYLAEIDAYRFSFVDNSLPYWLSGHLQLSFINNPNNNSLQLLWKLRVEGMGTINRDFNVPKDIVLTKVD